MLDAAKAILVIVDVQGKLAQLMFDKESLFANQQRMARGAKTLGIPILWNEQNPLGLGATIPELAEILTGQQPLVKNTFSCCGNPAFGERIKASGRRQVLLVGIETHVCVYQTAQDLLQQGFQVEVVADAVSSRTESNKRLGLERMKALGAGITSTEMALFELLRVAEGDKFKAILKSVK